MKMFTISDEKVEASHAPRTLLESTVVPASRIVLSLALVRKTAAV
jgi:hypothetical protein